MDKQTAIAENTIVFAAYLNGEDDWAKNGDILMDARRKYFLSRKKVKDKIFFTSGIDSVRCRYQIGGGKPMKWEKEVNGKPAESVEPDTSGNYMVICTDASGEIKKKIYFLRNNLWQKTEYIKNGVVDTTLTSCSDGGSIAIAVQHSGDVPHILKPFLSSVDSEREIIATAQTSSGEFFFAMPQQADKSEQKTEEEVIKRKGFFFDTSLIYGGFTTLNIKKGERIEKTEKIKENKENNEIKENNSKRLEDKSNTAKSEAAANKQTETKFQNTASENATVTAEKKENGEDKGGDKSGESDENSGETPDGHIYTQPQNPSTLKPTKIITDSKKEKYYYFGAVDKNGNRSGSGITLTQKGAVLYSGGYEKDERSGTGAQFYKNGKLSFVGKFSEDKKNGFGISVLNDGSLSVGSFENDRKKSVAARFTDSGELLSVMCYKDDSACGAAITVDVESGGLTVQKCTGGKPKNLVTVLDAYGNIIYNGEMTDGKFCGQGRLFNKNGTIKYIGEFEDNLQNGIGVLYLDDNSFISGEFLNGQIKGEATHRLSSGEIIYKGEFKDGVYSGHGTIYNPDGSFYSAEFENGSEKGAMSVYTKTGELLYRGELKNGEYNGSGVLYKNGEKIYEGGFADGKRSGMGREYRDNLCEYMGSFDGGGRSGFGISYNGASAEYSGFWNNDKYDGCGVLHNFENNLDLAGNFSGGEPNGRINVIRERKLIRECIFNCGKCVYMREYDESGAVVYEGSADGFVREGMGCSYSKYGEKIFEGIFKFGEPYKAMRVIPKKLEQLEFCDKLKATPYNNYDRPPVFVSEQLLGKGIYSGSLKNDKPCGSGTMLYTDHRYTGNFKDGKPCGSGILYFGDGKEISGEFLKEASADTSAVEFADAVYYLISSGDTE